MDKDLLAVLALIIFGVCAIIGTSIILVEHQCNRYLKLTQREGFYDMWVGGGCFVKTQTGKFVLKEQLRDVD